MSNSKLFQGLSLILAAFSEMLAADVAEKLRETFNSLASGGAITKPGMKAEEKATVKVAKPEPEVETDPDEKPDKVTLEDLRGKASELIDADRDALIKILKKNKVKRVSECPDEKLQTVYNDIVAALEGAECL